MSEHKAMPAEAGEQMLLPDDKGYFGKYGGRFVPEVLMPALVELETRGED
jgi:hypothetical protein